MARFPDGARVAFVGDSITATFEYEAIIANYYMENFPEANVRVYDSGVAGGTARWANIFLQDDILCHKPTHAFVMFGVNDSMRWRMAEKKSVERYEYLVSAYEGYKAELLKLCESLEANGVEVTLCTPPPYAEYQETAQEAYKGGYALLAGYAEYCRSLAKEKGYPLCDVHEYLTKKLQSEDLYRDDHVHPNEKGQYYIAKCMLEHQGLDLGEMMPIPESFKALRENSMIVRNILGVELMVIRNYTLPLEEKMAYIKAYVDEKKASTPYFDAISKSYLVNKPDEKKYMLLTEKLTDELMG